MLILAILLPAVSTAQTNTDEQITTTDTKSSPFDQFQWIKSGQPEIHELHFVGGYSFHSTRGFWGKIPGGKLRLWGLRYNRKILSYSNKHIIEYVTELNLAVNYNLNSTPKGFGSGTFSGFGGTPLGFQINFHKQNLIQPFFKTSAGFMYLDKQFPDSRGTKFNFTLELGTGVEMMVTSNISFTLGYKYHHMSNFFFGDINPGIDSNIFYTGVTVF